MKTKDSRKFQQLSEIIGLIFIFISIFIAICLIIYDHKTVSRVVSTPEPTQYIGNIGSYIAHFFIFVFGKIAAMLFPVTLFYLGINKFRKKKTDFFSLQVWGSALFFISLVTLLGLFFNPEKHFYLIGILGTFLADVSRSLVGNIGAIILSLLLLIIGIALSLDILISKMTYFVKNNLLEIKLKLRERRENRMEKTKLKSVAKREKKRKKIIQKQKKIQERQQKDKKREQKKKKPKRKAKVVPEVKTLTPKEDEPVKESTYVLPSVDLLTIPPPDTSSENQRRVKEKGEILIQKLKDLKIDAKLKNVIIGPRVTRFEIELARGIRVSQVANLSDDIAYSLKAVKVRVLAPVPGKSAVGFEVPNENPETIYLRGILESKNYIVPDEDLKFILGKRIDGSIITANLNDMPHLLIAGATGSGKSIFINSVILNFLLQFTPDQLKLVLIDPKRVELSPYQDIPHLLFPVVFNAKKAAEILKRLTFIMDKRYEKLARVGTRNIRKFNQMVREKQKFEKSRYFPEELDEQMPYIVVIIDELADMMVIAKNDVESNIIRLAQLARAVGIHLMVSTQRPSVDVITGTIKTNFPSRMSFQVSSKMDSRIILDMSGAEKLLGKGDMLYIPAGKAEAMRILGVFITDKEKKNMIEFWKPQGLPDYLKTGEQVEKQESMSIHLEVDSDEQEVYLNAVEVVLTDKKPSASYLQRRFKIGYNKAARLIERMEAENILTPMNTKNRREILITWEEYVAQKKSTTNTD